MNNNSKTLNYIIYKPRSTVTLDLYEAEKYEPAIIVQSLIGNLVYYSNQGRYEPRLAKQWRRIQPESWEFELNQGLICENGEKISTESFKQSLLRTILFLAKSGDIPILSDLVGYDLFLSGNKDLSGISTTENKIIFNFKKPVRDGLVQILSFAPFGYICKENLNADGSWKDEKKFISSGPYRIKSIEIGKKYVIQKRNEWILGFSENSPEIVNFTHEIPEERTSNEAWILDAFTSDVKPPSNLTNYPLIPEYINPIIFGNLKKGYFSKIENRNFIKHLIEKNRLSLPEKWGPHTRSLSFYPSQDPTPKLNTPLTGITSLPLDPLIIEGILPEDDKTPRSFSWKVLKSSLEAANIPYKFKGNDSTSKEVNNLDYDIRMRGSSIGGGVEAWGLRVLFCSDIGPAFPDPSGKICSTIDAFENDKISENEFANLFSKIVETDSAIVPISHYGIQLFLSPEIRRESLSPALAIVRFDKIEIN